MGAIVRTVVLIYISIFNLRPISLASRTTRTVTYSSKDTADFTEQPSLLYATKEGLFDIVKRLIENGKDLEEKDSLGRTPLHWAVLRKQHRIVEYLVEHGANVNSLTYNGFSPLHFAIMNGDSEMIEYLLKHGSKTYYSSNEENKLPIFIAIKKNKDNIVSLLIDFGAKINQRSCQGRYPLHIAVLNGNLKIVQTLIKRGASPNVKDNIGNTPLHYAARAEKDYGDIIEFLINHGANPYARNIKGETPLFSAVLSNNRRAVIAIIRTMKNLGLNYSKLINQKDNNGTLPIEYAAKHGNKFIVSILAKNGAIIDNIYTAAMAQDTEYIKKFLKDSALVKMRFEQGKTLLHLASEYGLTKIAMILLENGANVNALDDHNLPPLYYAVRNGHLPIVKMLLKKGAFVHVKTYNKQNLLMVASANNNLELVTTLIRHGADIYYYYRTRERFFSHIIHYVTPLSEALKNKQIHIATYLINQMDTNLDPVIYWIEPLKIAIRNEYLSIIRSILESKLTYQTKKKIYGTLLYHASKLQKTIILEYLLKHALRNKIPVNITYLSEGFLKQHKDLLNRLMSNGAKTYTYQGHKIITLCDTIDDTAILNILHYCGETPLHHAIKKRNLREIEKLLSRNRYYINTPDTFGRTPLDIAVQNNDIKIIKLLLKYRNSFKLWKQRVKLPYETPCDLADNDSVLEILNYCGEELHYFVRRGDSQRVALLLQHTDPNIEDSKGEIPLNYAISRGHYGIAKLLIKSGARVNNKNIFGWTPLHEAAYIGNPELVKLLMEKGANPYLKDKDGSTPCSVTDDVEILKMLHYCRKIK